MQHSVVSDLGLSCLPMSLKRTLCLYGLKKSGTFSSESQKGVYPGQDQCSVGPDMGPNCLQKLSADIKSHSFNLSKERVIRGNKI